MKNGSKHGNMKLKSKDTITLIIFDRHAKKDPHIEDRGLYTTMLFHVEGYMYDIMHMLAYIPETTK